MTSEHRKDSVRKASVSLAALRTAALRQEMVLRDEIHAMLTMNRGIACDVAHQTGISAQHLSDIRHGRRSPGDKVVAKLAKLK